MNSITIPFRLISNIILILAFLTACKQSSPSEFDESVSVLCVLQANSKKQIAFVHRTTGYSKDIFQSGGVAHLIEFLEPLFVYTANVSLLKSNQRYHFRIERKVTPVGSYHQFVLRTDSMLILPGQSYQLEVDIDTMKIMGEVTMPGGFHLVSPQEGQHFLNSQEVLLDISWQAARNASFYQLFLITPTILADDSTLIQRGSRMFLTETSDTALESFAVRFDYPGEYRLKVLAFDRNFFKHYKENVDRAGLNKGFGVLGGMVADSVTIYID